MFKYINIESIDIRERNKCYEDEMEMYFNMVKKECDNCKGKGYSPDDRICPECEGKGYIEDD